VTRLPTVPLARCIEGIRAGVSLAGENRAPREGEIGILTLGAVSTGRFNPDACKALAGSVTSELGTPVRAGTLLMSRSNTMDLVGATVLVGEDHPDRYLPDLLWEIRIRPDSPLTAEFLADLLATSLGRRLLQSGAMGTSGSMKKLSMTRLRALDLPAIPQHRQRAWTELRSNFDTTASRLENLIAAKRELKHGLRQELLTGRMRFPEFGPTAARQRTVLGRLPDDWRVVPLSDVVENIIRRNGDGTDRVLTCSGELGLIDQTVFFSKSVASESREAYFLLQRGEFAYNRSTMNGYPYGAIKRLDRYDAGVLSTLNICFGLRGSEWVSDFASQFFESGLLNRQLGRIARVGSRAHGLLNVSKSDFFAVTVPVPTHEEQHRIALTLNALDREIDLLVDLANAYEARKRGLMQQLLSGELTIPALSTDHPEQPVA
jgi:type I restriction enzyme S subunit